MRKIYSYSIILFASLALSAAFASAQTPASGTGSDDTTTDTGVVLHKYVNPTKNSDGTYTLTLEAFATGSSITSSKVTYTPLDIVLVLDMSSSMTASYTPSSSYASLGTASYSYNGYGTNKYYYNHTDGNYYLVSQNTCLTDITYTEVTTKSTYSYNDCSSTQYYYKNGDNFCPVTRGTETVSNRTEYTNLTFKNIYESNTTYYFLYNGTYYQVSKNKNNNKYSLSFKTGNGPNSTRYITSSGGTSNNNNTSYDGSTKFTGTLYGSVTSTTYYYLTFTDGGITYYLQNSTTEPTTTEKPTDVTGAGTTIYSGTLYTATGTTSYCLTYSVNGTTYYLNSDGTSSTTATGVTADTDTIYKGELYVASGTTRIAALKQAVTAFVNTVNANAKEHNVSHRISVVKFGAFKDYTVGDNDYPSTAYPDQEMTQVVKDFQDAKDDAKCASLISAVNSFTVKGSTPADWGLEFANYVLDGNHRITGNPDTSDGYLSGSAADHKKVVVFFTDGVPVMWVEDSNWSKYCNKYGLDGEYSATNNGYRDIKKRAVEEAKKIKDNGGVVYSVAVLDNNADNVKIDDETATTNTYTINQYMNYVSSNYPSASSMTNLGTGYTHNGDYYKLANGNLTDIFVSIAEEATSGGAKRELNSTNSATVDILTPDFDLPADVDASSIGLFVDNLDHFNESGETKYKQFVFDSTSTGRMTLVAFNGDASKTNADYVVLDSENKKISVTGFDYTKADVVNGSSVTYGNWVGPRKVQSGSTTTTTYAGRRLVITIPIMPVVDYEGGYKLPTNTSESGLYVDSDGDGEADEAVDKYPVPTLDFPSIGIIKKGLKKGESAAFSVLRTHDLIGIQTTGEPTYRVILTGNDSGEPSYTILKDLKEGTYKVTEESAWSWTYDLTNVSYKDKTQDVSTDNPTESVVIQVLAKNMIADWPEGINETVKCVLFTFTNDKKKADESGSIGGNSTNEKFDPTIYAESVVKNVFTGGNQKTESATTTNSKTQPGESTQSTTPE